MLEEGLERRVISQQATAYTAVSRGGRGEAGKKEPAHNRTGAQLEPKFTFLIFSLSVAHL